jgi:arylsulfatase A-like enzyme
MLLDMGDKTGSYEYDQFSMMGKKKGVAEVNWQSEIKQNPNQVGFDYFYGLSGSLDMPPYAYIENNKVTEQPSEWFEGMPFPAFVFPGERAPNFNFVDVGYQFANRSAAYIKQHAHDDNPFFLYIPMSAPHQPIITSSDFKGKTGLGEYADFVALTDFWVSKVIGALKEQGIYDNTIVIFTSDNGSFMSTLSGEKGDAVSDHSTDPTIAAYHGKNHQANGIYRGTKFNAYEGGHRVPFIVSWPERLAQGATSNTAIVTSDILPTLAQLLELDTPKGLSFDGESLSRALISPEKQTRQPFMLSAGNGILAIRDGDWKLIMGNGSGGFFESEDKNGTPFMGPYQLFNLADDPSETTDLLKVANVSKVNQALASELEAKALVIIGDSLKNAKPVL